MRSNLAQKEWNVLIQMRSASTPTRFCTRSAISLAALFVKVMAKIRYGLTPDSNKCAMRQVRTFVLPEPAPAVTDKGPSVCMTAASCLSFNVS